MNFSQICATEKGAFYFYDLNGIENRFKLMSEAFTKSYRLHYAMKANHNEFILKKLKELGAHLDVVSIGEAIWAMEAAGFESSQIVFSGVAKTEDEIRQALELGFRQLNLESLPEFKRVLGIAKDLGVKAKVSFRVNPDVEVETHPYIRTGMKENKFGVEFSLVDQVMEEADMWQDHIQLQGLSLHIGSQILDTKPFELSLRKTLDRFLYWQKKHSGMKSLDIGGGVGIDYKNRDLLQDEQRWVRYAEVIRGVLDPLLVSGNLEEVILEPGRFLVARFGRLFTKVQYIKDSPYKRFVIVDTGMHHLMRPSLYQAYHSIAPVKERPKDFATKVCDVVGPICESSDVLGHDRLLPLDLCEGEWLQVLDAGAYGKVMSNHYNMHPEAREIVAYNGEIL